MGDFKINVVNATGDSGAKGRSVNVMMFQTLPDPLTVNSYSSAWQVNDINYPGQIGPVVLPEEVQFFVLDTTPAGAPRQTGPFQVAFGQHAVITQETKAAAPTFKLVGKSEPEGQLKVTNASGNPKALEMALYKNHKKICSMKNVYPGDACYLAVQPKIWLADVVNIIEGEDFKAADQADKSTAFKLFAGKPEITIEVKEKESGELQFVETD